MSRSAGRRRGYPEETGRGAAAAATWIFRGGGSRRRRGVDIPRRRVAAPPLLPRGYSANPSEPANDPHRPDSETRHRRGNAALSTSNVTMHLPRLSPCGLRIPPTMSSSLLFTDDTPKTRAARPPRRIGRIDIIVFGLPPQPRSSPRVQPPALEELGAHALAHSRDQKNPNAPPRRREKRSRRAQRSHASAPPQRRTAAGGAARPRAARGDVVGRTPREELAVAGARPRAAQSASGERERSRGARRARGRRARWRGRGVVGGAGVARAARGVVYRDGDPHGGKTAWIFLWTGRGGAAFATRLFPRRRESRRGYSCGDDASRRRRGLYSVETRRGGAAAATWTNRSRKPSQVGFGFVDNCVMIASGEFLEVKLGAMFAVSTLAAAGLGNLVSDVVGLGAGGIIEAGASSLGFVLAAGVRSLSRR